MQHMMLLTRPPAPAHPACVSCTHLHSPTQNCRGLLNKGRGACGHAHTMVFDVEQRRVVALVKVPAAGLDTASKGGPPSLRSKIMKIKGGSAVAGPCHTWSPNRSAPGAVAGGADEPFMMSTAQHHRQATVVLSGRECSPCFHGAVDIHSKIFHACHSTPARDMADTRIIPSCCSINWLCTSSSETSGRVAELSRCNPNCPDQVETNPSPEAAPLAKYVAAWVLCTLSGAAGSCQSTVAQQTVTTYHPTPAALQGSFSRCQSGRIQAAQRWMWMRHSP